MWSFRKEIHKLPLLNIFTAIPCDEPFTFNGSEGVYIFDINIGTDVGLVSVDVNSLGIPDRFQIEYDGVIVADSLYVGDNLDGDPPNYLDMVGTTYSNIPELEFQGNFDPVTGRPIFDPNGNVRNITILQSDVAPAGATDGNQTLTFNKTTPFPNTIKIIVQSPLPGTAWNLTPSCIGT